MYLFFHRIIRNNKYIENIAMNSQKNEILNRKNNYIRNIMI